MYESKADRKAKHERYAFELFKGPMLEPKQFINLLSEKNYAKAIAESAFKLATIFIEKYEELYEARAQEASILHE